MKDSIRRKLEKLDERFEEISRLLSDAAVDCASKPIP